MNESSRRLNFRRFTTVELLVALGLFLVFVPFVSEAGPGDLLISALFSVVLLSAVAAVADRKYALVTAIVLAIPAVVGRWMNHFRPHLVPEWVSLIGALLLITFVVFQQLRFVLRAGTVDVEVLCASISAYLMLGMAWAMAYWLLDELTPAGAFSYNTAAGLRSMSGFNCFYFSFITLSTVGYGDITPLSKIARWLAAMEGIVGLLYVAVLIARLVSLYSATKRDSPDDNNR